MNKLSKILNYVMMIAVVASFTLLTSCGKDDGPVIVKEEGIPVADGFYITESGVDPTSSAQLVAESVEDDGFAIQSRDGYFSKYVYLKSGNHTIVNIVSKKITETFGGTVTTGDDASVDCGLNEYGIVATAKDGAAFSVASEGLYKVSFDKTTNEAILYKIEKVGLIGGGTPGGWGADTDLPGTVSADAGAWTLGEIKLTTSGKYKLRFNCNWKIDRRIDAEAGFAADNGYVLLSNLGGSPDALKAGDADMEINNLSGGAGIYTVSAAWTPKDGFSMTLEKTADLSFVPEEHPWGARGTAGIDWDTPIKLTYSNDNGTHIWSGFLELAEGEFKITDGSTWFGVAEVADETGGLLEGTDNISISAANAGFYYVVVTSADDGISYIATIKKASFGVIGDAANGWGDTDDVVMTESGSTWTVTTDLKSAGAYKFRANAAWTYNLGGDLTALTHGGDNLTVAADASYVITLTTSDKGETWTGTVE